MIRVTSGTAKGRRLELPKNKKITAVKEEVKLAIFNILGEKIDGSTCLDLYAGSGNLGIEALSRGAVYCEFVDDSKSSIEIIEKNLRTTSLKDNANVIRDDVLKFLANTQQSYDIIFADPYYDEINLKHLLKLSVERLNPGGVLLVLTSSERGDLEFPKEIKDVVDIQTRRYGKTLMNVVMTK